MSAKVSINYDMVKNTLVIPSSAVFYKEHKSYVLLKKDNQLIKKTIKIGKLSYKYIEILSGLKDGDMVVSR